MSTKTHITDADISIHDIAGAPEEPTDATSPEEEQEEPEQQEGEAAQEEAASDAAQAEDEEPSAEGGEEEPKDAGLEYLDPALEELGFPKLPDEFRADEAVTKRYYETQHGILKLLHQEKAKSAELEQNIERVKPYVAYIEALENPVTKQQAFEHLAKTLGVAMPQAQQSFGGQETATTEFEFDGERKAYERAKTEALSEFESKYGGILSQFAESQKQAEQERQFNGYIESQAPSAIAYLDKTESGWKVTKEMVREAVLTFPNLANDIPKAVKAMYPDSLASHKAEVASKRYAKRGPEIPKSGTAKAVSLPNKPVDEWTIHEIAQYGSLLNKKK